MKIPPVGGRIFPCRQLDRGADTQTDRQYMTKVIVSLRKFADDPKNSTLPQAFR